MNVREWALPVYTILMQVATGSLLMLWVIRLYVRSKFGARLMNRVTSNPLMVLFLTVLLATIGSHFHLSKPFYSFMAILNFKSSWLSREVFFTVIFMITVGCLTYLLDDHNKHERLTSFLGWLCICLGGASIYCMSMIYLLPTQPSWDSPLTVATFFTTALLLGAMALPALLVLDLKIRPDIDDEEKKARGEVIYASLTWFALLSLVATVLILGINQYQISSLQGSSAPAQTSLDLLFGIYRPLLGLRYLFLFAGVAWFGFSSFLLWRRNKTQEEMLTPIYLSCLLVMIAEILGRFLFYATHVRIGI